MAKTIKLGPGILTGPDGVEAKVLGVTLTIGEEKPVNKRRAGEPPANERSKRTIVGFIPYKA